MSYTKKEIKAAAKDIVKPGYQFMAQSDMYEDFEGEKRKSVFLGTVFTIMPSGKYYLPFASSNVTPCPRCKGYGKSKKPKPCVYCHGDGFRTVTEIAVIRQAQDFKKVRQDLDEINVKWMDGYKEKFECHVCEGTGKVFPDCNYCQGSGSREALEDEWMQEALDHEAEKLGCFIESGEGDPCDIFLTQVVENSNALESEGE